MSETVLATTNLSKRYRHDWALHDCTLQLPAERVAALVGPNGAGKTTLLHLAVGLLKPTSGDIQVLGASPVTDAATVLPNIGFVAQDHPLYRGFTLREMLEAGKHLNARWDAQIVQTRLAALNVPLNRAVGKLSGGQQAQIALALALAKRPELLLLDEPVASLDPFARREFLRALMDGVAAGNLTVMLSSHILADLERPDHLVVITGAVDGGYRGRHG